MKIYISVHFFVPNLHVYIYFCCNDLVFPLMIVHYLLAWRSTIQWRKFVIWVEVSCWSHVEFFISTEAGHCLKVTGWPSWQFGHLAACSWALPALFGGVIAGALDAALLQIAIVDPKDMAITSLALQLPLRCPVIADSYFEMANASQSLEFACFQVSCRWW